MHSVLSTVNQDIIAAMSSRQMSPKMVKFATNMMEQLSPEDMERMMNLANASFRSGVRTLGTNIPSMEDFSPEMKEHMRKQMKDPAMKQVMAEMTPEMMTSMSEQLGMKLSHKPSKPV
nr:outer envelope protein 61-like [Physcomitrium patens]|eukprot:XP_024393184.1 outer envelope protein 61-like [Physcomitrella patens]